LEKAGIPTAQICAITSVAAMVGSNRIIKGVKIVNPLCEVDLEIEEEKAARRSKVGKALEALAADITVQKVFE
jgi:glycine reductase